MHLKVIFEKMDGATPTTRLFFIRYLYRYGTPFVIEKRVADFVDELGIHDKGVRRALEFLVSKNYLRQEKLTGKMLEGGSRSRGRPKQRLSFGERFKGMVEKSSEEVEALPHASLINELLNERLEWEKIEGKRKAYGLKHSERLLLVSLYAHADAGGEIAEITFSRLTALTGLNSNRIRSHIKTLKQQGFILSYRHGAISKGVNEKRKSAFLLDIKAGLGSAWIMFRYDSDVIAELQRAVLLAHALKAIKGELFKHIKREEKLLWLASYNVGKKCYKAVQKCIEPLWSVREIRGRKFHRFCALICNLAAELLLENESDKSAEEIKAWIMHHESMRKFINGGSQQRALIVFFSHMVPALFNEVRLIFTRGESAHSLSDLSQCSISVLEDICLEVRYTLNSRELGQKY